jgi:hypothetical protein
MPELMTAASPVEIEAKADEAGLPPNVRDAALSLFHDLTSRLELAALALDQAGGEEWPRHRFYFGPKQGAIRRLLEALREQPDTAEVTTAPSPDDAAADTLFVIGSDGAFTAVLVACADAGLLRSLAQQIEARLPGPAQG